MNNNNGSGSSVVGTLLYIVAIVFYAYCMWRIFVKAGKPGWAAIIPFYNVLVELEIIGRPWWWLLLLFIPIVDIVLGIIILLDMAKVFGKGSGFGIGLILLSFIFIPILAFDDSRYLGPLGGQPTVYTPPAPPQV